MVTTRQQEAGTAEQRVQGCLEFRVSRPGRPVRRMRLSGKRYTFGSGAGCSIRLDDTTLRGMHAVLLRRPGRCFIRAYSVPVLVNGRHFSEVDLAEGDVIELGSYRFELMRSDLPETPAEPLAADDQRAPQRSVEQGSSSASESAPPAAKETTESPLATVHQDSGLPPGLVQSDPNGTAGDSPETAPDTVPDDDDVAAPPPPPRLSFAAGMRLTAEAEPARPGGLDNQPIAPVGTADDRHAAANAVSTPASADALQAAETETPCRTGGQPTTASAAQLDSPFESEWKAVLERFASAQEQSSATNASIERMQQQLADMAEQLQSVTAASQEHRLQAGAMAEQCDQLQADNDALARDLEATEAEVAAAEAELQRTREQSQKLGEERQQALASVEELTRRCASVTEKLDHSNEVCRAIAAQRDRLTAELRSVSQQRDEQSHQSEQLETELEKLRGELKQTLSQRDQIAELRLAAETQTTQLGRDLQSAEQRADAAEQELEQRKVELETLRLAADERVAALQAEVERAERQRVQAEELAAQRQAELVSQQQLIDDLREQIEHLQQAVEQSNREADQLRAQCVEAVQSITRLEANLKETESARAGDRASWEAEAEELREAVQRVSQDLAVAVANLSDSNATADALQRELEQTQTALSDAQQELEQRPAHDGYEAIQQRLEATEKQLEELQKAPGPEVPPAAPAPSPYAARADEHHAAEKIPMPETGIADAGGFLPADDPIGITPESEDAPTAPLTDAPAQYDSVATPVQNEVSPFPADHVSLDTDSGWPTYETVEEPPAKIDEPAAPVDDAENPFASVSHMMEATRQNGVEDQPADLPHEAAVSDDIQAVHPAGPLDDARGNTPDFANAFHGNKTPAHGANDQPPPEQQAIDAEQPVDAGQPVDADLGVPQAWPEIPRADDPVPYAGDPLGESFSEGIDFSAGGSFEASHQNDQAFHAASETDGEADQPTSEDSISLSAFGGPWETGADNSLTGITSVFDAVENLSPWEANKNEEAHGSSQADDPEPDGPPAGSLASQLLREIAAESNPEELSWETPLEEADAVGPSNDALTAEDDAGTDFAPASESASHSTSDEPDSPLNAWMAMSSDQATENANSSPEDAPTFGGATQMFSDSEASLHTGHDLPPASPAESSVFEVADEDLREASGAPGEKAAASTPDAHGPLRDEPNHQELPLQEPNQQPSDGHEEPPSPEPSQASEDEDESIEAYMNRLLQRVQGRSEGAPPSATSVESAVPAASATGAAQPVKPPTAGPEPTTAAPEPTTAAPEPSTEAEPEAPYVPRSQAPERSTNMAAMRELANTSARTAIQRSMSRQQHLIIIRKLAQSVGAILIGGVFLFISQLEPNWAMLAAACCLILGLYWVWEATKLKLHFTMRGTFGSEPPPGAQLAPSVDPPDQVLG